MTSRQEYTMSIAYLLGCLRQKDLRQDASLSNNNLVETALASGSIYRSSGTRFV
ncbi:hypothetical protein I3842_05G010000 [Carya illinoinensis]|uniref:Uncharacterized protein n=1 Tax=Carya illinoinensis TaxID=32201 RepID=A0A922EXQ2_CARIL|nr:hypothetical protein I3842_05G010000 [Carya illinoinensis]